MLPLKTFLTSKLAKSTETSGTISSLNTMLEGYDVLDLWLYCMIFRQIPAEIHNLSIS